MTSAPHEAAHGDLVDPLPAARVRGGVWSGEPVQHSVAKQPRGQLAAHVLHRTLFRLPNRRRDRGDSPDLLVRGEDWAEKISYELARMIGVPAAVTELATTIRRRDGQRVTGSMSLDIRPMHWQRSPGASLLAEHNESFNADTCKGHSLNAIRDILREATGPLGA